MTSAPTVATVELRLRPDRTQRLEALLLGAGPHLEPVLDVGGAANGDLVVVLPVPAARLTTLLEAPGGLTPGESVTVLVPLAQALHRLHAAGVAHGGIRAGAVVLDADGSPAWTAPLAPSLLRAVGPAAFAVRVGEDEVGFRALCGALLGPASVPDAPDLEQLAVRLFAVAPPEPVRLVRSAATPPAGPPSRLLPASAPTAPQRVAADGRAAAVLASLRVVRPRTWGALGAAAVLLATAVVLLPSGDAAPAATAASTPVAPTRTASTASSGSSASSAGVPASTGPADALRRLLADRDRCLERGSEPCLRGVDAAGSPVLDADLAAVRAGVDAARLDPARLTVTASGATALGTVGRGTALAIRDRNGWRLRDVVAEPPVGR
ncbi:hypothetical protein [Amnibacterium kyonggiense]|uniref:Protein kinase domain-containing protein n=1 Tax=Amnibacterium kyonggiense TaxID=595671 RepID=A0A4R7FM86_9MICO|nr:hypothetical protein [Amnibacterium kyonggiense]TDS77533.1 hypothetical protein CLV52_2485 [Amnibacterium kyonggiense]